MGEAKRRKVAGLAPKGDGTKPPEPTKPGQRFGLVPAGRLEQVAPDGTKYTALVFHVVTPDGVQLVEQTPAGPVPVTVVSQAIPLGRAVLVPPARPVVVQ